MAYTFLYNEIREMGGAPRNPAPRNHFSARIVKPSGCHCTDAFGARNIVECRHPLGAHPLSLMKTNTHTTNSNNNCNNNDTNIH